MSAFADVGRVLFEPEAVFTRVDEKPRFWQPFVVLAVALVVIQFLLLPYAKLALEPMYAAMPPDRAATDHCRPNDTPVESTLTRATHLSCSTRKWLSAYQVEAA